MDVDRSSSEMMRAVKDWVKEYVGTAIAGGGCCLSSGVDIYEHK